MAFQPEIVTRGGKVLVLPHGNRCGCYFLTAGLPSIAADPTEKNRVCDCDAVANHTSWIFFPRSEMVEKASELGVSLPAGKNSKATP